MTDTEIAARIAEGELHLFDKLAKEWRPRLVAFAYGYTRDRDEAEDIVQAALLNGFRYIASYNGGTKLYTWMCAITRNAAFDWLRKRVKIQPVSLDELPEHYHPPDLSLESNPEERAQRSVTADAVRAAVTALPPELRHICVLRELQDVRQADIAVAMDLPIGTVKSRLNRTRKRLEHILRNAAI